MIHISLSSKRTTLCNGASRRDFLRVGALLPFGLSLSGFLSMQRAVAADKPTVARPSPRAKSVILVFLGGGLSHHDSFDMKPLAVEEIRGKYKSIPSNVTGLHVCELLPRRACPTPVASPMAWAA